MARINAKIYFLYFLLLTSFVQETAHGGLCLFRRDEVLNATPGCSAGKIEDDSSLILRLLQFYRISDNEMNRGDSMWQYIFNKNHLAIHQIFLKGPFDAARDILRNPSGTDLFYGIDTQCNCFLPQFQDPKNAVPFAKVCLDLFMRFAESIGALPLDNPEAYYLPPIPYDAETVLSLIERSLGVNLSFPNPYPYEFGVLTSKGIISSRVPPAIYQAWKIKELVKNVENPRVLEIGAGLGRTAYFANLLGIKDYTIIDLPFTAVCSGYFLGRCLGEDQILLHGEKFTQEDKKIKILTPADFFNSSEKYDLIINVDSMTEMDPKMARNYLNKIESSTKIFLSINHDSNNFTVADLIREHNSVLDVNRDSYWMRTGYIEELVIFK